jgi:hypothetical protein
MHRICEGVTAGEVMKRALVEKELGRVEDSALHGCAGDFNRK